MNNIFCYFCKNECLTAQYDFDLGCKTCSTKDVIVTCSAYAKGFIVENNYYEISSSFNLKLIYILNNDSNRFICKLKYDEYLVALSPIDLMNKIITYALLS